MLCPSNEKLFLLNLGAFVHEICQRIQEMVEIDQMHVLSRSFGIVPIYANWIKLLTEYSLKNVEEFRAFGIKLGQFLAQLSNQSNQIAEEEETKRVKMQIHLKKLANALLAHQKFGEFWQKLGENERKEILAKLLGRKFGPNRFEHLADGWKKIIGQIEIGIISQCILIYFLYY